ncbi:MAG: hypothetical protein FJ304_05225, partial [Planctomycetes bacterium]|nr:hypothetical protein [Planctomycetota bacterium]
MSRLMLCGLMAGVFLCSSAPVRADDAEDEAAALIAQLGGTVTRDEKAPGKPVVTVSLTASSFGLIDPKFTDELLKVLATFKSLATLHLGGSDVTDALVDSLRNSDRWPIHRVMTNYEKLRRKPLLFRMF